MSKNLAAAGNELAKVELKKRLSHAQYPLCCSSIHARDAETNTLSRKTRSELDPGIC
ncbi:hypothetical protein AB2G07_25690 (plasmid) [Escherichia coli]